MRLRTILSALATASLVVAGCAEENPSVFPIDDSKLTNGRIYYTDVTDGSLRLISVAADGTDAQVVMQNAAIMSTSPHRNRMLIMAVDKVAQKSTLVLTDSDGKILDTIPTQHEPAFAVLSPDAQKVCYGYWDLNNPGRQLYTLHLVRVDGTDDVKFTAQGAWESVVAFSPNSAMLAFYLDAPSPAQDNLCVVNSDGSGLRMLTDKASSLNDGYGGLAWSDASNRIYYMLTDSADNDLTDIWSIGTDGDGAINLTADIASAMMPAVSPDGATIAFSGGSLAGQGIDIWTMNADGSGKRNLTGTAGKSDVEVKPRWAPDGAKLLCISFDIPDQGDVFSGRLKSVDVAAGTSTFLTATPTVYHAWWSGRIQ